MGRKTIEVATILEKFNRELKRDDYSDEQKKILCTALETILFETDNYAGYNDNYWLSVGCTQWHEAGEPDFPEKNKFIYGPSGQQYNRFYYYSKTLARGE